ncbi:MAG TPA: zinc ribbon domain-containing protein [Candidatus Nitrosotenuis sp.]|nr:zinc ribbon domain-containing protein [Candidatus Nitrosotenuis sp.]
MSVFETELKNGRLVIPECPKCQKTVWPPIESCTQCFGNVVWRTVNDPGTLIEYSSKDGRMFCVAEFEKIRIMGALDCDKAPIIGQKIRISSCGFDGSPRFTFVPE